MATPLKLASRRLVPQILLNHVRYGHKFKTKKPRVQKMERRVFEAVTQPIIPQASTSYLKFSCRDPNAPKNQPEEKNPYEDFLIGQLKKLIDDSKMIIICHRLPCTSLRLQEIKIDLKLKGMKFSILNNGHMRMLIEDTDKANLSLLLSGYNMMITSPDIKIKEAWSILRKSPEVVPLGGYCHDRLVTRNQLQDYSKLPSLELLLGELVSCLNLVGGARTSSLLSAHQQTLSTNLEQYHKQKSEDS